MTIEFIDRINNVTTVVIIHKYGSDIFSNNWINTIDIQISYIYKLALYYITHWKFLVKEKYF